MSIHLQRLWRVAAVLLLALAACWPFYQVQQQQLTELEAKRLASQPGASRTEYQPRLDQLQQTADFAALASTEMAGRRAGQAGIVKARQLLVKRFDELGLIPAGTDGFLHSYRAKDEVVGINVIGRLPGLVMALRPIVISAHYDHLGERNGKIYHGADDNASGVAAMLALADYFARHPSRHPLVFVALDHEEQGMQGAQALFTDAVLDANRLALNVNLDMLSRDSGAQLFAVGTYQHPQLLPFIEMVQNTSLVALKIGHDRPSSVAGNTPDWSKSSDHGVFDRHGVPFLYFGVPDHVDYHQPSDTFERADLDFYHKVSDTVLSVLLLIDQSDLVQ